MRRLRETAGLTIDDAAETLLCDRSKMNRIETGHRGVRLIDLRLLLERYGVTDQTRRAELTQMAKDARRKDWWDSRYGDLLSEHAYSDYLMLENDAQWLRCYEALLVPGLLQSEEYARAIFAASRPEATAEQIDALVEVRLARQENLDDLRFWAVIDEAALRRPIGGVAVMRDQLQCLAKKRKGVTLQVLPFAAGAYPGMDGSFVLLGFSDRADPNAVWQENLGGSLFLEDPEDVDRYTQVYEYLKAQALGPSESREMIVHLAEELR